MSIFTDSKEECKGDGFLHLAVLNEDVESAKEFIDVRADLVNDMNVKGETPLHLAMKKKKNNPVTSLLIEAKSDVNVKNKWGQTPLHYSVIYGFLPNLRLLLATPEVDVNTADVNGYTPLHCLMGANDAFGEQWMEGLHTLIDAGADINMQTRYGYHVLHLAAAKTDSSFFIKNIIENFPNTQLDRLTILRENFLHVYMYERAEVFENVIDTLEEVIPGDHIADLLNQRDACGHTPFSLMLEDRNCDVNTMRKMINLGASVTVVDGLGNTILHRLVCSWNDDTFMGIIDDLIRQGTPINVQNAFGETAASLIVQSEALDLFLVHRGNFNIRDNWGRSALPAILNQKPMPEFIDKLISEGKVDINSMDVYNSTPLHVAAFNDSKYQVEILLNHGAKTTMQDKLGDTPISTSKRHMSFKCYKRLLEEEDTCVLYARNDIIDKLVLKIKEIKASQIRCDGPTNVQLGLPSPVDPFLTDMLFEFHVGPGTEENMVTAEVNTFVNQICSRMVEYDQRFATSVMPTGSNAEGTKVGPPDEYDFFLNMDILRKHFEIVKPEDSIGTGFASLKFKEDAPSDSFSPFTDQDGYFIAYPYLQYLFKFIKIALNSPRTWENTNLSHRYENKIHVIAGKPVFNVVVYRNGPKYKHLRISIDLVPGVYRRGWWPADTDLNRILLMGPNPREAGCFLIF